MKRRTLTQVAPRSHSVRGVIRLRGFKKQEVVYPVLNVGGYRHYQVKL